MTGGVYADHTGRFSVKYSQGNIYVMVIYDYDSSDILMRAIKNRTKEAMKEKYKELCGILLRWGLRPQMKILDTEF